MFWQSPRLVYPTRLPRLAALGYMTAAAVIEQSTTTNANRTSSGLAAQITFTLAPLSLENSLTRVKKVECNGTLS